MSEVLDTSQSTGSQSDLPFPWPQGPFRSKQDFWTQVYALYPSQETTPETPNDNLVDLAHGTPSLPDLPDPILDLYEYKPLRNHGSIRVLKIYPVDKLVDSTDPSLDRLLKSIDPSDPFGNFVIKKEAEIYCTLEEVDLDDTEHPLLFDALSYTWSNPLGVDSDADFLYTTGSERCFPIFCDGRVILVPANLYYALLLLRKIPQDRMLSENPRQIYIWIDSICINQDDVIERGAQVGLMDRIYQSASTVIVWLGLNDKHTKEALEAMKSLCGIRLGSPQQAMMRTVNLTKPGWHQELGISEITNSQLRALCLFMTRAWFKRAWILQEVVFAKDIAVFCGYTGILWPALLKVIHLIQTAEWQRLIATGTSHMELPRNVIIAAPIRNQRAETGTLPSLTDILVHSRDLEASDPRDKVYAFLSFSQESNSFPSSFKADYTKCVQEVYVDATAFLIRSTQSLRALSLKHDDAFIETADLPSWVPDFNSAPQPHPLQLPTPATAAKYIMDPMEILMASFGTLTVTGSHFDTIKEIAPTWEELRTTDKWAELIKIALSLNMDYQSDRLGRKMSRAEVLWRTLLTNTYERHYPAPAECELAFGDWLTFRVYGLYDAIRTVGETNPELVEMIKHLINTLEGCINQLALREPLDSIFRKDQPRQLRNLQCRISQDKNALDFKVREFRLFADKMYTIQQFRRLFSTDQAWLGTGHQSSQVGDEIWLLQGLDVPVVLRRRGDNAYHLVGEAYVHGLMVDAEKLLDGLQSTVIELI